MFRFSLNDHCESVDKIMNSVINFNWRKYLFHIKKDHAFIHFSKIEAIDLFIKIY